MSVSTVTTKRMTMPEIKEKAKELGINPGKMKKVDLIHTIQMAERCTPCYGLSGGNCPWLQCCWRNDCFNTQA
jgi:hypothetical protein